MNNTQLYSVPLETLPSKGMAYPKNTEIFVSPMNETELEQTKYALHQDRYEKLLEHIHIKGSRLNKRDIFLADVQTLELICKIFHFLPDKEIAIQNYPCYSCGDSNTIINFRFNEIKFEDVDKELFTNGKIYEFSDGKKVLVTPLSINDYISLISDYQNSLDIIRTAQYCYLIKEVIGQKFTNEDSKRKFIYTYINGLYKTYTDIELLKQIEDDTSVKLIPIEQICDNCGDIIEVYVSAGLQFTDSSLLKNNSYNDNYDEDEDEEDDEEETAEEYYNKGYAMVMVEEWEDAIEMFSKSIKIKPDDYRAYILRAHCYVHCGDCYGEAIADYTKAIELNPNNKDFINDELYFKRAFCYKQCSQYEEAIKDFTKAIKLNPNEIRYNNRGNCYEELEQYEEAIEDYTKVIELNPDFDEAYYSKGKCYFMLEQYEEAIKDFTKAIKLNPNEIRYHNRGKCYEELEQYENAIVDYSKAIEHKPDYEWSYIQRGFCYRKLKQYKEAIEDCKKTLEFTDNEELKDIVNETIENIKELETAERKREVGANLLEALNNLELGLENDEVYIDNNDYCKELKKLQETLADYSEEIKVTNPEDFDTIERLTETSKLTNKILLKMKVKALIENENDEMLETYKKELSELSESELCLLKAEAYLNKGNRKEALPNFLIACISDESKYEDAKAIIHDVVTDTKVALGLEESLADLLTSINNMPLSTKEKIEYCKSNNLWKEVTINTDVISNIYADSKKGRKLDL